MGNGALKFKAQINKPSLYKTAFRLAIATIIFAFAETIVSTYYGYNDESLSLLDVV